MNMRKNISFFFLAMTLAATSVFAQFDDMPHHAEFLEKQKIECSQSPSKRWDSQRNSCVTLTEVKERRDDIRECQNNEKYPTAADKKRCHEQVAERETGVGVGEGDRGGSDVLLVSSTTAALSAIMMFSSEPKFSSACMSRNIFAGTSVVGLAAEFFYKKNAKKKLEELQEAYKKETAQKDAYHAQKRAFEFLKEEQLAIKEFEEKRRNALYIMTAGYAAAALTAVFVDGTTNMTQACGADEKKPDDPKVSESSEAVKAGETENVATSNTTDTKPDTGEPDPNGGDSLTQRAGAMLVKLNTPMAIAISSGVAGAASLFLAQAADKQATRSKNNADAVQEIIDQFEADFGQFCPQGRDDLKDPNCYCYNLDGSENTKRSNSNICLNLWAQRKNNLFAGAGSYDSASGPKKRSGCAFINGQFDEDCRCREMKNPQGQNACLKVGVSGGVLGQLGHMNSFPTAIGNLNNMAQGGLGTGEFNPQSLSQNAIGLNANARRAIEQVMQRSSGKNLPSNDALLAGSLNRIPARVFNELNSRDPSPQAFAQAGRPQSEAIMAALEKAKLTPEELNSVAYSAPRSRPKANAKKADDMSFFDDWGSSSSGSGGGNILNFMEKNYEYKGNDIVQRDDVSLWQIISNRYTQSGLRRLFGEEGDL